MKLIFSTVQSQRSVRDLLQWIASFPVPQDENVLRTVYHHITVCSGSLATRMKINHYVEAHGLYRMSMWQDSQGPTHQGSNPTSVSPARGLEKSIVAVSLEKFTVAPLIVKG